MLIIRFAIYTLQFECNDTKSFSYTQARGGVYAFFRHKASIFTQKEGVSKNDSGFFISQKLPKIIPKFFIIVNHTAKQIVRATRDQN